MNGEIGQAEVKLGVFIPGRLNSERLPDKLILPLNDKGDTLWSIACNKLNNLPEEYVKVALTCDKELIDIAKKYPNIFIIDRDELTSISEGPMSYIFKDLKIVEGVTHWMFLNPCLALLKEETIKESLSIFKYNPFLFATSVKKCKNWFFTGEVINVTDIDYNRLSTKEIQYPLFEVAHAFHIFERDFLFGDDKNSIMSNEKPRLIVIPKEETIDVDTKEDFNYLKYILK